MTAFTDLLLVVSDATIVLMGSPLLYVSLKAYHRSRRISMLVMSLGFAVIVIGSMIHEILVEILQYPMINAHIIQNFVIATGLLFLVSSISTSN